MNYCKIVQKIKYIPPPQYIQRGNDKVNMGNIYLDDITKRMSVNSKENNAKEKCFSIPKFRDKGKWGGGGSAELGWEVRSKLDGKLWNLSSLLEFSEKQNQ